MFLGHKMGPDQPYFTFPEQLNLQLLLVHTYMLFANQLDWSMGTGFRDIKGEVLWNKRCYFPIELLNHKIFNFFLF